MIECENCEGMVSSQFVKVFYPNENNVSKCPKCSTMREIREQKESTKIFK